MKLRQAARSLCATPGITIASVVVLALGIGASTAVFSVVNGLLLRPLPVADQDRLVFISKTDVERSMEHYALHYPEYVKWRERSRLLESVAAFWPEHIGDGRLSGSGDPARLPVLSVSGNFFQVLGTSSQMGRTLRPEDDRETPVPPLVLSHRSWTQLFGSDPDIVGRTVPLRLETRTSFVVVGVMPETFDLFPSAEGWVPVMATHPDWAGNRGCECDLIGRLARGSTAEGALAELQSIHENVASEEPDKYRAMQVVMEPLLESIVGQTGRASVLAFSAVALLLAIAIANAAALSLIRALGRTREAAIRTALGAGAGTLLRERLAETILIAGAALAGGFLVARLGIQILLALKGAELPRAGGIAVDPRALLFGAGIAALATAVCAFLPTLVGAPASLRARRFATQGHVMQWMVAAEIALTLPLLFAAALMARTLLAHLSIDRGFDAGNLVTIDVPLHLSESSDPESRLALFEELVRRVEALPGVASVTALRLPPGTGTAGVSGPLEYEGQAAEDSRNNPMTNIEMVMPSYFSVLGVPIVRGRPFDEFDRMDSERVAIVSEEVAERYWPDQDPIGKRLGWDEIQHRVVGIASNTRYRELTKAWPTVYFPLRQNPFSLERTLHPLLGPRSLAVRTRLPPESVASSIRSVVRDLDPGLPLDRVAMMEELLDSELRRPRFHAVLASAFSLIALLLAASAVYSVFAAFVAQRLPELGIRSALGATPARLRSLVLNRSRNLVLAGIALGGIAAWWISRFLTGFLYGVAPFDVPTLLGATALLGVVSLLATAIPAHRAARVDPLALLKQE